MNIEFLKQSAVANILSANGKERTTEVIYQEINNIISIVESYSELKGYNDAMKDISNNIGKRGL